MTINIFETSMNLAPRRIIATAPTFAEAKAIVESMDVAFMEDDADHTDCADAYLHDGRILAIEPEGFAL